MEAEKAEDIEEVQDVERAKGRTSSRMEITGAAKFVRRWLQNGTRNFNLKNVWQIKEPTGAFFACVARKGVTDVFFASVARKEVSRFCVLGEKLARCRKAYRKRRANHENTTSRLGISRRPYRFVRTNRPYRHARRPACQGGLRSGISTLVVWQS